MNLVTEDGDKKLTLRFPTDEEWAEQQRKTRVIVKHLGRGKKETSTPGSEEVAALLLDQIQPGEKVAVDSYTAERIITAVGQVNVDGAVREGNLLAVTLRVPGGITKHTVRIPSAKELKAYNTAYCHAIDLPYSCQELRINIMAAGELYDAIKQSIEGYACDIVPVIHKVAVVRAVTDAVEIVIEDDADPNP